MSSQSGKDVIYIDIDDEITAIIDKVRGSEQRIVALVLPKRANAFQSIVNMKLLKRTADNANKHLVLITNETGLLPLAGAVGIYVAKTLQTKPEIPDAPNHGHHDEDDEEAVKMEDDTKLDRSKPISAYAGAEAVAAANVDADEEAIDFDNDAPITAASAKADAKKSKPKKDRKLAIPDFNKFRTWIVIGGVALVALIFFLYIGLSVMPRATVTVKTDSSAIESNLDVTFDSAAEEADIDEALLPSKVETTQKTATQQVTATGQKDKGTKASGQVTLSLKDCSQDTVTIPAGTGLSANGLTYVTQQNATLGSVKVFGQCKNGNFPDYSTETVDVVAQSAGDKYNASGSTNYTVAGFSNVSASGNKMEGGTSNIVKVISQADVDSAKQKLVGQDADAIKMELSQALKAADMFAVTDTFANADPEVTTSAAVGDEAENVTVTAKTTYSMTGVKEDDLKKIIANEVNKEIDTSKQAILDYGLSDAVFKLQNTNGTKTLVTLSATSVAGSDLDLDDIKKQVAGKKANDAKKLIGEYPGVTDVTVHYSPFWVSSIPKKVSKITLTVEKPSVKNAK
jgi:hypothetical protein